MTNDGGSPAIEPASDRPKPRRGLLDFVPDSWGPKFDFDHFSVTLTRTGPNAVAFTAGAHYVVQMLSAQSKREVALSSGRSRQFAAEPGTLEVIPAASDFSGRWHTPKENCLFAFDRAWLDRMAEQDFDCGHLEMRPPGPGTVDKVGHQIARLIRNEIATKARPSRLYLEGLVIGYAANLLRNHSSAGDGGLSDEQLFKGGLSPRHWKDIDGYLRDNLASDISLKTLSERCKLSYSHFLRAFRKSAGMPPYRYLLTLRLSKAQELILNTDLPLGEIARLTGFCNHSHMTATMRRVQSVTPGELRKLSAGKTR
ncbi:helix-turn-helix domain-containing protein [Nitratireductor sp. ZSWI3]|uniref:helix-turn-helix domain-containing protein n=1 Tax=Nitratireductor sp. ZSWI3 TaxID=2966359 RepID=UPI00214FE386|nr:helix-turn-helix domain-containing protein [Nitratireductor sp. ZSWI3]MCR4268037.1 helix-turn-helix domain-containing protein [Nitratireductor sp. ZSWI3]